MDNMQLWLSSSTDSINLNDSAEGFYLNPDLEGLTGLPEIRSVNGLNAGYDGGWTATQLWAARLITIRGVIALNDKAAVETKRKALAKLMAQGKNESLQLKFVSESGNVYTTSVRTTYCTMALKRVFWRQEYQIQLRADDPLIYDDGGAELVAILRVMAGVNGFEIPFEIPFAIGDSADPTDVNVGDEATYPLITLKGDLHSPTIVNLTTNQQMQVLADIITHVEWKAYTTAQTIDGYSQIQDGLQDAPLSLTHLYGNATQQTYTGKNLIKFDDITETNKSIYYYLNQAPAINTTLVAGQTYTFSADLTIGGSVSSARISMGCGTTNYTLDIGGQPEVSSGKCSVTFTPTVQQLESGTNFYFRFPRTNQPDSTGVNYSIKNVMLEKGSTATDFEPYVGSIPSPNPDFPQEIKTVTGAQTVKITGKNLFDKNAITSGYLVSRGVGTLSQNSSYGATGFIPVRAGQQLHFGDDFNRWYSAYYDANKVAVGEPTNTANITIPDGVAYLRTSLLLTNLDTAQLELGTTATAYEPYQGQSQEINLGALELAKIGTYQDYIWNDEGTWKIHKAINKIVLDGTENWSFATMFYCTSPLQGIAECITPSNGNVKCDYYTFWAGAGKDPSIDIVGAYIIRIKDADFADVSALTTWLSAHNATVYYALATPTETEITDSELIEQLNHVYELYQGTNNLWLIPSAGAQGEMEVTYATDKDVDYHEVVIDCQARTVTQDGQNLYPALAPGSEFIQLVPGQNRLYLTSTVSSDDGTAEVKFKKGNISI